MVTAFTGQLLGIYIATQKNTLVSSPLSSIEVTLEGLVGDKHSGFTRAADARTPFYPRGTLIHNNRQVSLLAIEELAEIAERLNVPEVHAEDLGANILLSGIPHFSLLPPNTRLFFPHATLIVSEENKPCIGPAKVLQARYPDTPNVQRHFVKMAMHKRGVVAWVEKAGSLQLGDEIRVQLPDTLAYPG